jgi:flagellar hook-associated protein 3 FlgL
MQIRQNILFNSIRNTSRIQDVASKMYDAQMRAITGVRVHQPSDAPGRWASLHGITSGIADQKVWSEGADRAQDLLDMADTTLDAAASRVQVALERAIQLSSETYSTEERTAAAAEIASIKAELVGLANTKLGDRSLFAGDAYDGAAFDAAGTYLGTTATNAIRIGASDEVLVSIDGSDAFGSDVFQALTDLEAALAADDPTAVAGTIDRLESGHSQLVSTRSELGFRQIRVDDARAVSASLATLLEGRLTDAVAADPVEAFTEFAALQTSYEAALQITATGAGSKLFDFMR